eukprot:Selendium_serpulae@DN5788_c0_g2_i1.p1
MMPQTFHLASSESDDESPVESNLPHSERQPPSSLKLQPLPVARRQRYSDRPATSSFDAATRSPSEHDVLRSAAPTGSPSAGSRPNHVPTDYQQCAAGIRTIRLEKEKVAMNSLSIGAFDGVVSIDRYLRNPSTIVVPFRSADDIPGAKPPRFLVITEGALLTVITNTNITARQQGRYAEVLDWGFLVDMRSLTTTNDSKLKVRFEPKDKEPHEICIIVDDNRSLVEQIKFHIKSLDVPNSTPAAEESEDDCALEIAKRSSLLDSTDFVVDLDFIQDLMKLYQMQVETMSEATSDTEYVPAALSQIKQLLSDPRVVRVLDTQNGNPQAAHLPSQRTDESLVSQCNIEMATLVDCDSDAGSPARVERGSTEDSRGRRICGDVNTESVATFVSNGIGFPTVAQTGPPVTEDQSSVKCDEPIHVGAMNSDSDPVDVDVAPTAPQSAENVKNETPNLL